MELLLVYARVVGINNDDREDGSLLEGRRTLLRKGFASMVCHTTEERIGGEFWADSAAELTDEELLVEYRATGSQTYFAELVRRYERELYNYLRRYLGNASMAEDAFQATFLQIHLRCELFQEGRRFRPWLYTIATNQAIDAQRRNRRHRLVSLDRPQLGSVEKLGNLIDTVSGEQQDPVDQLQRRERNEWVRTAVAALPEQLRTAVSLVYFRGMKYREAADEMAIPVGTVKSRLHSAIQRLTQAWQESSLAPQS